jgi:pimeloyl-ACP methyl ester carboxylesterase
MDLYYKNENVIISNDFFDFDLLVISFSPLVDEKQLAHSDNGFGKSFFQSKKISCVYVIPTWNHWYQREYIHEAMEILKLLCKNFKKVVLYGVSMGAYAALKYANYLPASDVISISPQAVIMGPQSEFDNRFAQFWNKIEHKSDSWLLEKNQPYNTTVFYDKHHDLDNQHAEIISRNIRHAKMVGLPFSGHEVFAVLNEAGILSDFVFTLLNKSFDGPELLKLYRKNRHKSGVTWMYAALNSAKRGRARAAGKLFQQSIKVIEWRKTQGLTIDQAKARMTVMEYVNYCFALGNFSAFLEVYERFSHNKIIKIDLQAKHLECFMHLKDKSRFIDAFRAYTRAGGTRVGAIKNVLNTALRQKLVTENDLV